MVIVNVPKMMCYLLLILLAVFGQVPWWVPVAVVLYDLQWVTWFYLPWNQPPKEVVRPMEAPEEVPLSKFLQLGAMMGKATDRTQ